MSDMKETDYKYVAWVNHGYEGWSPTGYEELEDAYNHESYGSEKVITSGAVKVVIQEEIPQFKGTKEQLDSLSLNNLE